MIPVGAGDGAGVVVEVEAGGGGGGSEFSIAGVEEEAIAFVSAEGVAAVEEFVDFVGALEKEGVGIGREEGFWGFVRSDRHDLSPEETSEVVFTFAGDEAVGDGEVFEAVVVEVGEDGAPGPAALTGAGGHGDVCEGGIAVVEEEGIPAGGALEFGFDFAGSVLLEFVLEGDAVAGAGEHVSGVEVDEAVGIGVAPTDGHAEGGVFDAGGGGVAGEGGFSGFGKLVAVEIVAAVVVGDVDIEVAVGIDVFPRGGEAEAVVFGHHAGLLGGIDEVHVVVAEEDVLAAVVGVVVGDGIGEGGGVAGFAVINADVEIEVGVVVVVDGGEGVASGGGVDALGEGELSGAVVFENESGVGDGEGEVLVAVVVEVDEEAAAGGVEEVDAGFGGGFAGGAVGLLEEEFIGNGGGLAEVEVIEAVAIDVANGEAVVAEVVHGEDFFDAALPVVDAVAEVVGEVGAFFDEGAGGVGEEGAGLGAFDELAFGDADGLDGGVGGVPSDGPSGIEFAELVGEGEKLGGADFAFAEGLDLEEFKFEAGVFELGGEGLEFGEELGRFGGIGFGESGDFELGVLEGGGEFGKKGVGGGFLGNERVE